MHWLNVLVFDHMLVNWDFGFNLSGLIFIFFGIIYIL